MTDVLLLMDYQEGICRSDGVIGAAGMGAQAEQRGVLPAAARVLEKYRELDLPRVFVRVAFDADYQRLSSASPRFDGFRGRGLMIEDSDEAQICSEIAPLPGERVVSKGCVIPFIGTNLTSILTKLGATRLVLGGVATNMVVEGTARVAADSGYAVTVLEDLCASSSIEAHEFSVGQMLPAFGSVQHSEEYLARLA
ncbi:cysteine hydrolase family protein [Microbacterium sp. A93]|uniref:cysteine hydrolase family protein n=1 Tax=Microbacterium sp. A93 TaxID=3450716 RepID=UPI003F431328